MTTYYYGYEALGELAYEDDTAGSAYGTAVSTAGSFQSFSWLRSANISVNPHVVADWNISGGKNRTLDKYHKEYVESSGNLVYWIPKDFDASPADDIWLAKLGLDAYNVAPDGATILVPLANYGSFELLGFTLELGHNKTGSIRAHVLSGCAVDSFTCRARSGAPVEFTMDFPIKTVSLCTTGFTSGSVSRSTAEPVDWSDCVVYYADDATAGVTATAVVEFEFTINNNLEPRYDLNDSSTKEFNRIIVGRKEISGRMTVDLTTNSGLVFWDALTNDATAPYTPQTTAEMKELGLRIGTATQGFDWRFRDVALTEIPMDIDPTTVQQLTIPWTSGYCTLAINTLCTALNTPNLWDLQA